MAVRSLGYWLSIGVFSKRSDVDIFYRLVGVIVVDWGCGLVGVVWCYLVGGLGGTIETIL